MAGKRRVNKKSLRWPGLVAYSSHSYSDKYFDDNYYTAFQRPTSDDLYVETGEKKLEDNSKKKTFSFAGFSDADTVVTRVKR